MSIAEFPATVDCVHVNARTAAVDPCQFNRHRVQCQRHPCVSSKRKLDEYAPNVEDDDYDDHSFNLVSVRMKRSGTSAIGLYGRFGEGFDAPSTSLAAKTSPNHVLAPYELQVFVRRITGNTMVMRVNFKDSVISLHERIRIITGIPVFEQRLVYMGRQLDYEDSLIDCSIHHNAELQLVGRMRSTEYPEAWHMVDTIISLVLRLCRGELVVASQEIIHNLMTDYLILPLKTNNDGAIKQLEIFSYLSAPTALVMLYLSPIKGNKEIGGNLIEHFLDLLCHAVPESLLMWSAVIVLEFCNLLRRVNPKDSLYVVSRSSLGELLRTDVFPHGVTGLVSFKGPFKTSEVFPFIHELINQLYIDLSSCISSPGPSWPDVRAFAAFLLHLRRTISKQLSLNGSKHVPLDGGRLRASFYGEEAEFLYNVYLLLLEKMDICLQGMEAFLVDKGKMDRVIQYPVWSQYLPILEELYSISCLFQGLEEEFWATMRSRKSSISHLVISFAEPDDDFKWMFCFKDVLNSESRRHLSMLMFPELIEDYDELHEMLIDRSQLLEESFEYITNASVEALSHGLFMEFKNEEATGPGVLREWFCLVCKAIFNPQNALFVACPNDRRRFFPNPASKVDPMHLNYFKFSGRIIALALKHEVQVGIVFDRVFFLKLAGMCISLEDIRDADPFLYNSCKQILDMDADLVDSDALGLTFVFEFEELGTTKVLDLCPGGKDIAVNSKNREEYVKLLIEYRFTKSVSEQITHFASGFTDILSENRSHDLFFKNLQLRDLDCMLYGSERAISVEDWKLHSKYNGFKENDPQISWFWEVVLEMSREQRKNLLFFWTSVKYLPALGFKGLSSSLYIFKSPAPCDHLPSSHTCFFRLCFPPYPTKSIMKSRLQIITQDHIGISFGTW